MGDHISLRAFVAMRIGQPDTDALYSKGIIPALRAAGVQGSRIDRIEHNDDIDDRILKEIRRADLILVDLTYARPSAYFEAGFAAGLDMPVIYTARRDHFRDKDDDPLGNLRVHFDLQMKNIIDWSEPGSATFRKRLSARVRHVARPLVRERQAVKAAADAKLSFSKLPMSRRLEAISDTIAAFLSSRGFTVTRLNTKEGWPYGRARLLASGNLPDELLRSGLVGTARRAGAIEGAWVRIEQSMTLARLRAVDALLAMAPPHDMNPPRGVRPNQVIEHTLLCSMRSVPTSRIQTAFKEYEQVGDGQFTSLLRQVVPISRTREEVLVIGRNHPLSPAWQALGFDMRATEQYPRGVMYDVEDGYLIKRPSYTSISFPFKKRELPKSERRGKVKEVPRRVTLHIIDGIESLPALEEKLTRVSDRMK